MTKGVRFSINFLPQLTVLSYCLLSTPMGVDYVVIGSDMQVQP